MSDFIELAKQLDGIVLSNIGVDIISGFEKAYLRSKSITDLSNALTDEYMKPIMALQGTKLGFLTDKDRNRDGSKGVGYPVDVVKRCLIEAVLYGLQPTDNQFNIIAGNMYPTKAGIGYLLNRFKGLDFKIVCTITLMSKEKKSANVDALIKWKLGTENENIQIVPIPIKIDDYSSVDSVVGKATRKAREWLLSTITGVEVVATDVQEIEYFDLSKSKSIQIPEKDNLLNAEDIESFLKDCKSIKEINLLWKRLTVDQQIDYDVLFSETQLKLKN